MSRVKNLPSLDRLDRSITSLHQPAIRLARRRGPSADTVDACAGMFRFCKRCDATFFSAANVQFLFDVDGGQIGRATLTLACHAVEAVLADVVRGGIFRDRGASVTVTLKRLHGVWFLAVAERRVSMMRTAAGPRRLALVRRQAQMLRATCRSYDTADGCITALMFVCADTQMDLSAGNSFAIH